MEISDIAKRAYVTKKLSKAGAHELLVDIIHQLDSKAVDKELIDKFAPLYRYFMDRRAKPRTAEQWVALAVPRTKDVRYYLNYVYCDGAYMVATDGHRLHVIEDTREAGYYDKALNKLEEKSFAQYPDYWSVIPPVKDSKPITAKQLEQREAILVIGVNAYKLGAGWGVNMRYIQEALSGFDDPRIYLPTDMHKAIRIQEKDAGVNPSKLAVVMPMRL